MNRGSSTSSDSPAPSAAPIQNDPLIETIDDAAHACGDQLVYGRVDCGVLAADAAAREEATEREGGESLRPCREQCRDEIYAERHEEEPPAAITIREPAEDERTDHGAAHVCRCRPADFARRECERLRTQQCGSE
jgi:hypothetical protein